MGRPDLRDPLEPALDEWLQADHAVLPARAIGVRPSNRAACPRDDATFAALTALFQIDCALRELRRELDASAGMDRSADPRAAGTLVGVTDFSLDDSSPKLSVV